MMHKSLCLGHSVAPLFRYIMLCTHNGPTDKWKHILTNKDILAGDLKKEIYPQAYISFIQTQLFFMKTAFLWHILKIFVSEAWTKLYTTQSYGLLLIAPNIRHELGMNLWNMFDFSIKPQSQQWRLSCTMQLHFSHHNNCI